MRAPWWLHLVIAAARHCSAAAPLFPYCCAPPLSPTPLVLRQAAAFLPCMSTGCLLLDSFFHLRHVHHAFPVNCSRPWQPLRGTPRSASWVRAQS